MPSLASPNDTGIYCGRDENANWIFRRAAAGCGLAVSRRTRRTPADEPLPDAARDPVVLAVQKVLPAVVNISTERIVERQFNDPFDELFRQFFGQPPLPRMEGVQSLGSGVIVDEDGWIVTNWHVVRRATKITVVLADGTKFDAQYVSGDEKNDLALLKIQPKKPLPSVEIAGDSQTDAGRNGRRHRQPVWVRPHGHARCHQRQEPQLAAR